MKAADDPTIDYKVLVRRGYDLCAGAYSEARESEAPELALLAGRLGDGATVLDVGCGAGAPITKALAQHFGVTGVDISGEMIQLARVNVPQGSFIHGDIMSVEFPPSSFDAAVAFYSVFHLPREEHRELFLHIYQWLKPGGYLLATLTHFGDHPYTEDDFHGATMYWSNYGIGKYKEVLAEIGFKLLDTSDYEEAHDPSKQHHPLVFAQKGPNPGVAD